MPSSHVSKIGSMEESNLFTPSLSSAVKVVFMKMTRAKAIALQYAHPLNILSIDEDAYTKLNSSLSPIHPL